MTTSVVVVVAATAAWMYYQHLNHNLRKGQRSSGRTTVHQVTPDAAGRTPVTILLIGSDSRNSADDVALGGAHDDAGRPGLADVEMLLHLSADRRHAAIVSVPRDTRADIPECTDPKTGRKYPATNDIVNESLARGGPGCTLATLQNLTGVYIDHWMMVDFAGVVRMADAIGGVDVCVKQNVWDRPTPGLPRGGSGLKLTAGTHTVKGEQALQWLRTRDSFGSDLGRAQAQHLYLASMVRELRSRGVFGDPAQLMGLAESATQSLQVSEEIGSVAKLYDLATQLQSVPPDRVTMTTMPNIADPQDDNHLLPDPKDAPKVWAMLRDDVPFDASGNGPGASPTPRPTPSGTASPAPSGTASPARLPITVVNGTAGDDGQPVPGRATDIAGALTGRGFADAAASDTVTSRQATAIVYPADAGDQGRAQALAVANSLHLPVGSVQPSADAGQITLTIGADWPSGTDYTSAVPAAGSVPSSADVLRGSDDKACMDVYQPYQW
ncbi:LCP family protein [Streptantibioticus ferralitis]|uniref:LCP family protein n=2 Tax=Streptantibioticus ferralitis TaxID=236510 RepID=A0ABT5Z982_9ACTN|nr:LCP family protein [Streptantibioticus ferralitis]